MENSSVTIIDIDIIIDETTSATAMLPFFSSAHSSTPCVSLSNTFIASTTDSTATISEIANSPSFMRNNSHAMFYFDSY